MEDFFDQFIEHEPRKPYRIIKVSYSKEFYKFSRRLYNAGLRKEDFFKRFQCERGIREYYDAHPEECERWLDEVTGLPAFVKYEEHSEESKVFQNKLWNYRIKGSGFEKRFGKVRSIRAFYDAHKKECEEWIAAEIERITGGWERKSHFPFNNYERKATL